MRGRSKGKSRQKQDGRTRTVSPARNPWSFVISTGGSAPLPPTAPAAGSCLTTSSPSSSLPSEFLGRSSAFSTRPPFATSSRLPMASAAKRETVETAAANHEQSSHPPLNGPLTRICHARTGVSTHQSFKRRPHAATEGTPPNLRTFASAAGRTYYPQEPGTPPQEGRPGAPEDPHCLHEPVKVLWQSNAPDSQKSTKRVRQTWNPECSQTDCLAQPRSQLSFALRLKRAGTFRYDVPLAPRAPFPETNSTGLLQAHAESSRAKGMGAARGIEAGGSHHGDDDDDDKDDDGGDGGGKARKPRTSILEVRSSRLEAAQNTPLESDRTMHWSCAHAVAIKGAHPMTNPATTTTRTTTAAARTESLELRSSRLHPRSSRLFETRPWTPSGVQTHQFLELRPCRSDSGRPPPRPESLEPRSSFLETRPSKLEAP